MTLEEAKRLIAQDCPCLDKFAETEDPGIMVVEHVLETLERSGYVLCNKTLTMDQRNQMSDAFHNNFQSMQAVHDVMLKGVK